MSGKCSFAFMGKRVIFENFYGEDSTNETGPPTPFRFSPGPEPAGDFLRRFSPSGRLAQIPRQIPASLPGPAIHPVPKASLSLACSARFHTKTHEKWKTF